MISGAESNPALLRGCGEIKKGLGYVGMCTYRTSILFLCKMVSVAESNHELLEGWGGIEKGMGYVGM